MTKTIFDKWNNKYANCVVNKQNWNRFDRNGIDASKIRYWKVIAFLKSPDKRDWLLQSREVNCVGSKYNAFTNTASCYVAGESKCEVWVQRGVSISSTSLKFCNYRRDLPGAMFFLTSRITLTLNFIRV